MDTDTTHEHEYSVSSSHRRALRSRLATALIVALLVAVGAAGIDAVVPEAINSVFNPLHRG